MITTRDMLRSMETGKIFSCTVVTYDDKRGTGGKVIEYDAARLVQSLPKEKKAGRAATRIEAHRAALTDAAIKRDPNHRSWYTRNIRLVQQGHDTAIIRKIHPPLVIKYDGQLVVP